MIKSTAFQTFNDTGDFLSLINLEFLCTSFTSILILLVDIMRGRLFLPTNATDVRSLIKLYASVITRFENQILVYS